MSEIIPFFNRLPDAVIPLACRLWDKARSTQYNGQADYQVFAEETRFLGIEPPTRAITRRWIAGVQAGLIDRPAGETIIAATPYTPRPKEFVERRVAPVIRSAAENTARHQPTRAKAIAEAASRQTDALIAKIPDFSTSLTVPPLAPTTDVEFAAVDVEALAERLYAQTLEELQRGAAAKAAKLVAGRLREIADRYDADAA